MKITKDSAELTAYALGELDDAARRQVAAAIEADPALQEVVDEIRSVGNRLEQELARETAPELTDTQRAKAASARSALRFPTRASWAPLLSAAAAVVLLLGVASVMLPSLMKTKEAAKIDDSRVGMNAQQVADTPLSGKPFVAPAPLPTPPTATAQPVEYERADDRLRSLTPIRHEKLAAPGWLGEESGIISPSIEHYSTIVENTFRRVSDHPLSTFSIDVDTASYANVRRFLTGGQLPPIDAVRIEEMINYFDYDYDPPRDGSPFATHLEAVTCPWKPEHQLVRIGIKGRIVESDQRPSCNLVFLLDVSGSMSSANKLGLVKRAMSMLVKNLNAHDRVAIVVYAGASGLVLPSTACNDEDAIIAALERLSAGGSTNGGAGIQLAYATAQEHFIKEGINRVILCTDGDFNVGVTQGGELTKLIKEKAKSGVFLSVLGFGMGNYKDSALEQLADKGNGNYAYIDTFAEARKVLVDELSGTLVTIAKDVKIQVEFNPSRVAGYRLIGYENRMLKKEDFNDDTKDAGEIGAGHRVTALYEVVPLGLPVDDVPAVDPLKYQRGTEERPTNAGSSGELLTVKIRSKLPDADQSTKQEFPLEGRITPFDKASADTRFAASVAAFGMLLRSSEHAGSATFDGIIEIAGSALGEDEFGYRRAFVDLVRTAKALKQ